VKSVLEIIRITSMTKQKSQQKSIAFGKPYFYATKSAPSGKTVEQAVCTNQSTVFLTSDGKIYQTGTLHGQIFKSPTLVEIRYALKCVEIAAGRHFCLGRLEGGQAIVSWGAGKRELVVRPESYFISTTQQQHRTLRSAWIRR
jgi:alpha-tubulin suppressor-like RCC1 family protein